jgi:pantoate--beta-alanine ligase
MNIVSDIKIWQKIRREITQQSIGFVPTMGNLHQGHASLCARAKNENQLSVVSIFVNPTQFNQKKDLDTYPRTLEQDITLLESLDVDYLLIPEITAIYPDNYQIQIHETLLSKELEGEFRHGHFDGMLTIVLKLLNLISPHHAYFGEKDYQQFLLIKKMAAALFLSTEIIACPTFRADDGLALSSRNSRLTSEQRKIAQLFPKILNSSTNTFIIKQQLEAAGFKIEYVEDRWERRLAAVLLGDVRLIDNFSLTENKDS